MTVDVGSPSDSTADHLASSIEVLECLAAVRKRPAMYFGDLGDGAIAQIVWELVANVLDQHLVAEARTLAVAVETDGSIVIEDDGPGISLAPDARRSQSTLETILTTLHAGATFDGHFPHVHLRSSLRGVGLAAVNAVCARFELETHWGGSRGRIAMVGGRVVEPLEISSSPTGRGTRVRFWPDAPLLRSTSVPAERIEERLRELAWLCPLLAIIWQGRLLPGLGGLRAWIQGLGTAGPSLVIRRTVDDVEVDIALGWAEPNDTPELRTYVNFHRTETGTHRAGLMRALLAVAKASRPHTDGRKLRRRLASDLVGVVHVGLLNPRFGAPVRAHLTSPEAGRAVARAVRDALPPRPDHPFRQDLLRRASIA